MARREKQTVDYFPHMCSHGKTMFIVEQKFGNDGYAFWFKLLEMLGSTEGHALNCRDDAVWEFLQAKTRLSEGLCIQILDLLAKLGAIDADLWVKSRVVWSQNFVNNVADVYKRRKSEPPKKPFMHTETDAAEDLCLHKPDCTGDNVDKKPQSKVNKSKVYKDPSLTLDAPTVESSSQPSSPRRVFTPESQEMALARRLRQRILFNAPNARVPPDTQSGLQPWCRHIDLILRVDKRPPAEVEAIIDWCQSDPFWMSNILSPRKLREKYDTLVLRRAAKRCPPESAQSLPDRGDAIDRYERENAEQKNGVITSG